MLLLAFVVGLFCGCLGRRIGFTESSLIMRISFGDLVPWLRGCASVLARVRPEGELSTRWKHVIWKWPVQVWWELIKPFSDRATYGVSSFARLYPGLWREGVSSVVFWIFLFGATKTSSAVKSFHRDLRRERGGAVYVVSIRVVWVSRSGQNSSLSSYQE